MSSLQQNWRRGENRFWLEARGMGGRRREAKRQGLEVTQTLYAHLNKCIDNLSPPTKGKVNGNT
jgi:hypothetical protein